MRKALSVMVLGLGFVLALTPAASAQQAPVCEGTVVDSGGLFGSRKGEVESTAATLAGQGIDVRVRTVTSTTPLNINNYVASLKQCPSWKASNGAMKNNLFVLLLYVQKDAGGKVLGGSTYVDGGSNFLRNAGTASEVGLTQLAKGSIGGAVDAQAKQAKYVEGAVAGLRQMGDIVARLSSLAPAGSGLAPATQVTNNNRPVDLTGLWIVLGLAALVIGLLAIYLLIIKPRGESEDKESGARSDAQNKRSEADSRVIELSDRMSGMDSRIRSLSAESGVKQKLLEWFKSADSLVNQAVRTNADLAHRSLDDPGLTTSGLKGLSSSYAEVVSKCDRAFEILSAIEADISRLEEDPKAVLSSVPIHHEPSNPVRQVSVPSVVAERADKMPALEFLPPVVRSAPSSRLSRRALSAIDSADNAIGRAERYILTYDPWIDYSARESLIEARRKRDRADRARSSAYAVAFANDAVDHAERALDRAQRDRRLGVDYTGYGWYRPWDPWYGYNSGIVVVSSPTVVYQEPSRVVYGGYTSSPSVSPDAGVSTPWSADPARQEDSGVSIPWSSDSSDGGSKDEGVSSGWSSGGEIRQDYNPEPSYSSPEPEPSYSAPEPAPEPSYSASDPSPSYDSGGSSSFDSGSFDSGSSSSWSNDS